MSEEVNKRILVLGVTGMLGSTIFSALAADSATTTFGTVRQPADIGKLPEAVRNQIVSGVRAEDIASLAQAFSATRPDVVINCVGIIKQLPSASDYLASLTVNALFPHQIAKICEQNDARFVHFSTDCVFSGSKGEYRESDLADADDLYGRSKKLGEVEYGNAVTLRTSIIGHEIGSAHSLIDWFLAQQGEIKGYRKAIFSGLPTVEVARVLRDYVIPNPTLRGLYHLSVDPISKLDLLRLVAEIYGKDIQIIPTDDVRIDRSLNSDRFRSATGFEPKDWPRLIDEMHHDHLRTGVGPAP